MPGAQLHMSRNSHGAHDGAALVGRAVVAGAAEVAGRETHVHVRQPLLSVCHWCTSSLRKQLQGWAGGHVGAAVVEAARTVVAARVVATGPHEHELGHPRASVAQVMVAPAGQLHEGRLLQRAVVAAMVDARAVVAGLSDDVIFWVDEEACFVVSAPAVVTRAVEERAVEVGVST